MNEFAAGPRTEALWQQASSVLDEIATLPFLRELGRGELDPARFVFYVLQDDFYLAGYARSMALLAAKAGTAKETRFWAESVTGAIAAEEDMHRALLADTRMARARERLGTSVRPSPTTLGYLSYLEASAALGAYRLGVAAVLPCFWVYAHVGRLLARHATDVAADHPYRAWIAMYESPAFDEATRAAVAILEHCLATADAAERDAMERAFQRACTYELHFWDAAYILQDWRRPSTAVAAGAPA